MRRFAIVLTALAAAGLAATTASANAGERYRERSLVRVAPGLQPTWLLQMAASSGVVLDARLPGPAIAPPVIAPRRAYAYAAPAAARAVQPGMDPVYLPRIVAYAGKEAPGTIVIDSKARFLYLVEPGGKARRYGVGVGKPGFGWTGTHHISRKAEWPGWTPPAEMVARERENGRVLPDHMDGGLANPLGARALYLGSTLYRIHGTNAPWTIGHFVSSGCIRMRNQDVMDLYGRVSVGTKVVVL
ncbi:L,D-transpeptidase [Jiella sp. M17.18]|uniref:L,D-transpeptidase n=1 Tax=Jiella sp. M17.18 TaxID=3234247 RepID=UPI0034DF3F57